MSRMWRRVAVGAAAGFASGCAAAHAKTPQKPATDVYRPPQEAGARVTGLPDYSLEDVRAKATKDGSGPIWVTFRDGVYDITEFVEAHPGGDKILMAAGGSIEPFWQIYQVHRESSITMKLLESMRIGNVAPADRKKQLEQQATDPYAGEPSRHPALEVLSMRPFNAEPPKDILAASFFTPNDTFYVRNHLPVPVVDESAYRLTVEGADKIRKEFTLEYLKKNFPHTTVPVTIQCAGNRRVGMSKLRGVDGLMWDSTAISNAEWTGVRLSDVLKHVGANEEFVRRNGLRHVLFEGMDGGLDGNYGASVSYDRAIDPDADVLLAWEMNGVPLPPDHGFPIRVVAPGIVGARSVKWLRSITLSPEESQSLWQQKDYKNIGPSFLDRMSSALAAKEAPPVREMPVQSAILIPDDKEEVDLSDNMLQASGYAWGGGGRGVQRVDVTIDGGNSWVQAELSQTQDERKSTDKYSRQNDAPMPRQWAWTLWQAQLPVESTQNKFEMCVKAVNSANDTQPETPKGIWNLRGLLNNSWHCIDVTRA
eukprot:TRINITY_DN4432_c0_g3_i1.p1 TRINITY_DN4432_c0_g3~~TRINITY_DN4432_c0_g3_i1.p1  ORF type:complete len:537 (+),score=196.68 TRINITY_DN4432_c0_g3_i1:54-1664(+)